MKKSVILLIILFYYATNFYAQVGIGTDMPNASTMLDIRSDNRGILIPQVALTDILDQTTIAFGNVESLLVYNTTDNQTLDPGYYYWQNGQWRGFLSDIELPDFIVFWDVINNQFSYLDENGNLQTIDISSLETLTTLQLNPDGRTLEYSDEKGQVTVIDLGGIINNLETVTSIVNNNNGTYTFTNEDGETTLIDVIADVVTNIQNQGDIYNEIINLINAEVGADVFTDNGDGTFTHTSLDGTSVTFDANTLTMSSNGNGNYTFTNANGDSVTVDVIADVVTNIQNQGDIYNEIINIVGTAAPQSFVKANATSPLLLGLTLLSDYRLARFNNEVFDENNEFDTTTSSFVAQQDGIYSIHFQADSGGLISAAEFGVGIFKTDNTTSVETLVAEERYLSVNIDLGLLQIDVSPPIRSTQTLVKLQAGDRIRFGVKAPLLVLQLLGSNQNSFTIHQVK